MTLNLGWFSSGKDESARALLSSILKKKDEGLLDISIKFVFCNWEEGEEPQHPDYAERQKFFQLVRELGIPLVTLSWKRFRDSLKTGSKEEWRAAYGEMMRTLLESTPFDLGILAGYNLWIDRDSCSRYQLLNLYPSLPGGPLGTAQEVICQIITQRAGRHGIDDPALLSRAGGGHTAQLLLLPHPYPGVQTALGAARRRHREEGVRDHSEGPSGIFGPVPKDPTARHRSGRHRCSLKPSR